MHARPTEGCVFGSLGCFLFSSSLALHGGFLSLQSDFYCPSSAVGNECTFISDRAGGDHIYPFRSFPA